jgi:hypothetical protein
MSELRHESEEAIAKHEIAILETLQELKVSDAKQLAKITGIPYISVRLALKRQQGIGIKKITGGWQYLDEPGDGIEPTHQVNNWRLIAVEHYLKKIGVNYTEIRKEKSNFAYTVETPITDVQIGDLICLGKTSEGRLINRIVLTKTVKKKFTELSYKQGIGIKHLVIKNTGAIATQHRITKAQIDQWRKDYVATH